MDFNLVSPARISGFADKLHLSGESNLEEKDKPLSTLDEFLSWPGYSTKGPPKKWTPSKLISHKGKNDPNLPQVLFCHDMHGGYEDDAYCYGNSNSDAYRFYHWHLIDQFIYFSHNLVTIPPVSWIDIAHRNGVQVLGCFLTEGWIDEGKQSFEKLFAIESLSILAARQLNAIRLFYGFEGWLINLESSVSEELASQYSSNIITFLRTLRKLGSHVIWYDAFGIDGKLNYQNALTDINLPFFHAAGAIYLNYGWNMEKLISSQAIAGSSHHSARVFVGVDCFGRGTLGGGGFNTREAVKAIRGVQGNPLSVALFAPGWVYENAPKFDFYRLNARFWTLLAPYLRSPASITDLTPQVPWLVDSGPSGEIIAKSGSHDILNTGLCLGQGVNRYEKGQLVAIGGWNSIVSQHFMPNAVFMEDIFDMIPDRSVIFTGGNSLRICTPNMDKLTEFLTKYQPQPHRSYPLGFLCHNDLVFLDLYQLEPLPVTLLGAVKLVFARDPNTKSISTCAPAHSSSLPLYGLALQIAGVSSPTNHNINRIVLVGGDGLLNSAHGHGNQWKDDEIRLVGSEAHLVGQCGTYGEMKVTWTGWQWNGFVDSLKALEVPLNDQLHVVGVQVVFSRIDLLAGGLSEGLNIGHLKLEYV